MVTFKEPQILSKRTCPHCGSKQLYIEYDDVVCLPCGYREAGPSPSSLHGVGIRTDISYTDRGERHTTKK